MNTQQQYGQYAVDHEYSRPYGSVAAGNVMIAVNSHSVMQFSDIEFQFVYEKIMQHVPVSTFDQVVEFEYAISLLLPGGSYKFTAKLAYSTDDDGRPYHRMYTVGDSAVENMQHEIYRESTVTKEQCTADFITDVDGETLFTHVSDMIEAGVFESDVVRLQLHCRIEDADHYSELTAYSV